MGIRNFRQLLEERWRKGFFVCVGLDSEYAKIPQAAKKRDYGASILFFNKKIVDAVKKYACAFKLNAAYYDGIDGRRVAYETVQYILANAPDVPIILDGKWGDVDNTDAKYAEVVFDGMEADAATVSPYLGGLPLQKTFLGYENKGVFVLCRTSNPGAGEFQDLPVGDSGEPLYLYVARSFAEKWNGNKNCGLVVGATCPDELIKVREVVGDEIVLLIPGVGAQGGDLQKTVEAGMNSRDNGFIINSYLS